MNFSELRQLAQFLRLEVMEMLHNAEFGYLGGSMSIMDVLVALYFGEIKGKPILKYDPKMPDWEGQDYLILSKAHAAAALYTVLAEAGFFPKDKLRYFLKPGSDLQVYPGVKTAGVVFPGSSMGEGLSVACGLALAIKLDGRKNRVYCVLSDEELQEGQVWEAVMSSAHFKLDNLIVIIDRNKLQADGEILGIMDIDPVHEKFKSFGWRFVQLVNGHDFESIFDAFDRAQQSDNCPSVIIAHTVKGKGVIFAENRFTYHRGFLSKPEMEELKKISGVKEKEEEEAVY